MFIINGSRRKEDLFKEGKTFMSEGDQDCQKNIKSICINESVLTLSNKTTKNIAGIVTEVSQKA
jgi:hypothetical protein